MGCQHGSIPKQFVGTIAPAVCYRDGKPTAADYDEAIEALQRAKRQDECRHLCCSVCEDTGHTAETCHHNPLTLARRWAAATKVWACYHCGFVATNDDEAREHFGAHDADPSWCRQLSDRVDQLEKHSHPPYDFTHLVRLLTLTARASASILKGVDPNGDQGKWRDEILAMLDRDRGPPRPSSPPDHRPVG